MMIRKLALVTAAAMLLAACKDEQIDPGVPMQLQHETRAADLMLPSDFKCLPEPDGRKAVENAQGAIVITGLRKALRECRRKLTHAGNVITDDRKAHAGQ